MEYLNLKQLNERIPEVGLNEQQLQALGFSAIDGSALSKQCTDKAQAARWRSAKLYLASDVPNIRRAIGQAMGVA